MLELNVFKEIPGNEKFHSCILACYSLDCYFFEQRVLRVLRAKGIRNISVITDATIAEDHFKNILGNIKKISSLYTLTSIVSRGAFHPKLYMFFGDNEILMIIGSGNLTSGGMGKNHELFISFYADAENSEQLPLLLNAWDYLRSLTSSSGGIALRQRKWIEEYCSLLKNQPSGISNEGFIPFGDGTNVAFLQNTETSLFEKIKQLINEPNKVQRITIAAPFFDLNGYMLDHMVKYFSRAVFEIYVQDTNVILPLKYQLPAAVTFYKWDETKIAIDREFKKADRFQHSKLFHFDAGNEEFLLIGSPNATAAAFLRKATEGNSEAAVLLRAKNAGWLTQLGVKGKKVKLDFTTVTNSPNRQHHEIGGVKYLYKIRGIDRYSREFSIYTDKPVAQQTELRLLNAWGDLIEKIDVPSENKGEWTSRVSGSNKHELIVFGALYDTQGLQVSNSQIINNVAAIEALHPSPENRRINKLLDRIIEGKYSEVDLFDFYDAIRSEKSVKKQTVLLKRSGQQKTKEAADSSTSYEEALERSYNESSVLGLENFEPLRIWDTYIAKLEQELRSREEEDIDDDEEGDLRSGKGREEKQTKEKNFESIKVFERAQKRVAHLYATYTNGLCSTTEGILDKKGDYEITKTDYAFFLLITTHLIDLSGRQFGYKTKEGEVETAILLPYTGELEEYCSFGSIALNVIGKFLLFLRNAKGIKEYRDEYEIMKMEHFKQLAWNKIIAMLAIMNVFCRKHNYIKWDKWSFTLLLNAADIFKPASNSIRDILFKEFNLLQKEDISIYEASKNVSELYEEVLTILDENSDL
ncbi:MAG: hypothetical protein GXC73_12575, partial [Chitinophagaceae bacterium]|nr:hypothetical protein [Chitinophagaceae bacterium]